MGCRKKLVNILGTKPSWMLILEPTSLGTKKNWKVHKITHAFISVWCAHVRLRNEIWVASVLDEFVGSKPWAMIWVLEVVAFSSCSLAPKSSHCERLLTRRFPHAYTPAYENQHNELINSYLRREALINSSPLREALISCQSHETCGLSGCVGDTWFFLLSLEPVTAAMSLLPDNLHVGHAKYRNSHIRQTFCVVNSGVLNMTSLVEKSSFLKVFLIKVAVR